MDKYRVLVKDFVDEDDKRDLYDECCDALKRLDGLGVPLNVAADIIRGVVREVRNNYGD